MSSVMRRPSVVLHPLCNGQYDVLFSIVRVSWDDQAKLHDNDSYENMVKKICVPQCPNTSSDWWRMKPSKTTKYDELYKRHWNSIGIRSSITRRRRQFWKLGTPYVNQVKTVFSETGTIAKLFSGDQRPKKFLTSINPPTPIPKETAQFETTDNNFIWEFRLPAPLCGTAVNQACQLRT